MSMLCVELDIFQALCTEAGTPLSLKASLAASRGDWGLLASLDVKPATYTCPATYLADAQLAAFFKKHPGLPLGVDRKAVAVSLFWEAERMCFRSNERLSPLLDDVGHYGSSIAQVVRRWRKIVRRVLGQAPSYDDLTNRIRFGPGSTFRNTGSAVQMAYKLSDGYTRTSRITPCLPFWESTSWARYAAHGYRGVPVEFDGSLEWCSLDRDVSFAVRSFEVVRGNRFTTVPKDAKKDRGICVEPSLNVAYQLALGDYISKRMKRSLGWDKRSAQEYHNSLARIASLTGACATIDLSMASDTICTNLARLVLPPDWFRLVDETRSPFTLIEGRWVKLEKLSSMGNGFTFELETLIFWSLALALQELEGVREDPFTPGVTTSVFGDDIIVPTSISGSLISALRFFGFSPNGEKTFLKGRFRESCGGDYMNGLDVRPHFQKSELYEPQQLIALANGIRRYGDRIGSIVPGRFPILPWLKCLDHLPRHIRRLRGPAELGDLTVTDPRWDRYNPLRVRSGIRYLSVWRPVLHPRTGVEHFRPGVLHALALFTCREAGSNPYNDVDVAVRALALSPDLRGIAFPDFVLVQLFKSTQSSMSAGVMTRVNGSYVRGYKVGRVAYS